MKNQITGNQAFACLAKPLFWLATCMILFNALFLQVYHPSWLSGKLGALGWMIVLPLVLSCLLSLIPLFRKTRLTPILSAFLVGLLFTLLKLSPQVNLFARLSFLAAFGLPLKLALDPSDLLVLPALLIPILIHRQEPTSKKPAWRYAAAGLLVFALLADAPLPRERVFACLAVEGNAVVLFSAENTMAGSNKGRDVYISYDDAKTWQDYGKFDKDSSDADIPANGIMLKDLVYQCNDSASAFDINHPTQPGLSYMFMQGKGVYVSMDSAVSYALDHATDQGTAFYDAVFTPNTGDLVIAVGEDGLLIRSTEGVYRIVRVDEILYEE